MTRTRINDVDETASAKRHRVHPPTRRLLAYLLVVLGGILGFTRLQTVDARLDDATKSNAQNAMLAKHLAEKVAVVTAQRDADNAANSLSGCKQRNTAQRNSRDRIVRLFQNLDGILAATGDSSGNFSRALQEGIVLDATKEDRDCNADGQLTEDDYSSSSLTADSVFRTSSGDIVVKPGPAVKKVMAAAAQQQRQAEAKKKQESTTTTTQPPVLIDLPDLPQVPPTVIGPAEKTLTPLQGAVCSLTAVLGLCH